MRGKGRLITPFRFVVGITPAYAGKRALRNGIHLTM